MELVLESVKFIRNNKLMYTRKKKLFFLARICTISIQKSLSGVLFHLKNHLFSVWLDHGHLGYSKGPSDAIYIAFFYETHNSDLTFVTLPFSSQSALKLISISTILILISLNNKTKLNYINLLLTTNMKAFTENNV